MSWWPSPGPGFADEGIVEPDPVDSFEVKDSGQRKEFDSGMVRDTEEGKTDYTYVLSGPMLERWAVHLMKGAEKYERDNWLLGDGPEEYERARRSALRHMIQWLRGDDDEDHAAAVFFNINAAEYFWHVMLHTADRQVEGAAERQDYSPEQAEAYMREQYG